jgi:sigma-B regulation protein RsbU (phosphoserine phosphatase)
MVKDDIEGASAAQRSMLPVNGRLSDTVETAWIYSPAMGVSGDCLDIYALGQDKLAFYLLDVSGHGVTSALRSAAISQLLRPISGLMEGLETEGPAHVMAKLNGHLCRGNPEIDYLATMVLGVLDAGNGILRIASAGHPPPLTLSQGQTVCTLTGNGIPLGIDPEASYNDVESVLQRGDTVLLYSDGLLECESRQGHQFGMDLLMQAVRVNGNMPPAELLAQLERRVIEWRAGAELKDDLSALVLKYTGTPLVSQA